MSYTFNVKLESYELPNLIKGFGYRRSFEILLHSDEPNDLHQLITYVIVNGEFTKFWNEVQMDPFIVGKCIGIGYCLKRIMESDSDDFIDFIKRGRYDLTGLTEVLMEEFGIREGEFGEVPGELAWKGYVFRYDMKTEIMNRDEKNNIVDKFICFLRE